MNKEEQTMDVATVFTLMKLAYIKGSLRGNEPYEGFEEIMLKDIGEIVEAALIMASPISTHQNSEKVK
jgi:hypothetical protein